MRGMTCTLYGRKLFLQIHLKWKCSVRTRSTEHWGGGAEHSPLRPLLPEELPGLGEGGRSPSLHYLAPRKPFTRRREAERRVQAGERTEQTPSLRLPLSRSPIATLGREEEKRDSSLFSFSFHTECRGGSIRGESAGSWRAQGRLTGQQLASWCVLSGGRPRQLAAGTPAEGSFSASRPAPQPSREGGRKGGRTLQHHHLPSSLGQITVCTVPHPKHPRDGDPGCGEEQRNREAGTEPLGSESGPPAAGSQACSSQPRASNNPGAVARRNKDAE